jgi:hypothetical protein
MTAYTQDLSVVIISRNEERNIAGCIESVLKATEDIDACEIVLVDSTSTLKPIPFVWGFLQPKKDPKTYPTNVKVIKYAETVQERL